MLKWILILILPVMTACLGPVAGLYPQDEQERPGAAYVISHGWHVGIAFEGKYLREKLPRHERIPESKYLMIGWGDNKYYPAENPGVGLFLRAAFLPTGSVIHIVGIERSVETYFLDSDIIRVKISEKGMDRMTDYIADSFHLNNNTITMVADGLYGNSAFFEAKGWYFFPKTSNRWVARTLRQSGFPITPFYAISSGNVIYQARKKGKVIRRR